MTTLRAIACLCAAVAAASVADAHAILKLAVPAADAVMARPPDVLQLDFNEAVDMAQSRVALTAPDGDEVSLGEPEAQPRFGTRILRQINQPLKSGVHTVRWRVLSNDGDWTKGSYRFMVQAPK